MKKRTSKACAVILSAAMVSGFATSAFAAPTPTEQPTNAGIVDVGLAVNNPVINVTLPGFTDIVVDPFSVTANEGVQMSSTEYVVLNGSAFPIAVSYSLDVITAGDVTLVEKADFAYSSLAGTPPAVVPGVKGTLDPATAFAGKNEMSVVDKKMFFGVVTPASASHDGTNVVRTYDTYSAEGGVVDTAVESVVGANVVGTGASGAIVAGDDATLSFSFALEKNATDVADNPLSYMDEARFRFYAQLNTYAPWQDNDVMIKGVYKITGLDIAAFKASGTGTSLLHGANMYAVDKFELSPQFGAAAKALIDAQIKANAPADVNADFYFGKYATVTKVEALDSTGTAIYTAATATDAALQNTANVKQLTLKAALFTALQDDCANQNVTLQITLSDGAGTPTYKTVKYAIKVPVDPTP